MTKMTLAEWVSQFDDPFGHPLGEYYTYLTGKPWQKKRCHLGLTVGFQRWAVKNEAEISAQARTISRDFEILRDWDPLNCFFRRRERYDPTTMHMQVRPGTGYLGADP